MFARGVVWQSRNLRKKTWYSSVTPGGQREVKGLSDLKTWDPVPLVLIIVPSCK
jgi:hypothetical protein